MGEFVHDKALGEFDLAMLTVYPYATHLNDLEIAVVSAGRPFRDFIADYPATEGKVDDPWEKPPPRQLIGLDDLVKFPWLEDHKVFMNESSSSSSSSDTEEESDGEEDRGIEGETLEERRARWAADTAHISLDHFEHGVLGGPWLEEHHGKKFNCASAWAVRGAVEWSIKYGLTRSCLN